jgi:uncharacterized protein YbaR (Trm112 family)
MAVLRLIVKLYYEYQEVVMELVLCKFCGKNISSEIEYCIHCGLNQIGYTCRVCKEEITNLNEIDRIKEGGLDEGPPSAIHKRCLQQIRKLVYVCPVCKESLSTNRSHGKCLNCGHPNYIESCEQCLEGVINDGNSGVTVIWKFSGFGSDENIEYRKVTYHKICAEFNGFTEYAEFNEYKKNRRGDLFKCENGDGYKGYMKPESIPGREKESSCFIVTAVHGNHSVEVLILQEFRDQILAVNKLGRAFIRSYEYLSPPVAKLVARNKKLRFMVREGIIAPMLWIVNKLNAF